MRADHDRIALLERSVLDQRRGHRSAPAIEPALDDDALGRAVGVGLQLQDLGLQRGHLEQLIDARALLRRGRHEDRLAAPVFRDELEVRQLALDAVGIGLGLVDLVDGHDDRHIGGARVVDGLLRLRHHAVVGGDDEDDDVGGLGAARAHSRERLVTRRVQERDFAVRGHDLIGADVLGDAAELLLGHLRLSDGVEQRRLAVVDVTHDGDDGRPEHLRAGVGVLLLEDIAFHRADLDVEAELVGDELGLGGIEQVVDHAHDAQLEQALDDLARLAPHLLGQLGHRDRLGHADELATDLCGRYRRRLDGRRRDARSRSFRRGPRRCGRHTGGGRHGARHGRARGRRGCRRTGRTLRHPRRRERSGGLARRSRGRGRRRRALERSERHDLRLGLRGRRRPGCRSGRPHRLRRQRGRGGRDPGGLRRDLRWLGDDDRRLTRNLGGPRLDDRRGRLDLGRNLVGRVGRLALLRARRLFRHDLGAVDDRAIFCRRLRLRDALELDRFLRELAPLAKLGAQLVGELCVEGSHGTDALVSHLLGGEHQILARDAELFRQLDDFYLGRCHCPLTSPKPPFRSTPSPPRSAA